MISRVTTNEMIPWKMWITKCIDLRLNQLLSNLKPERYSMSFWQWKPLSWALLDKQMQMMLWCNKWRSRTTINNINKFPVREAPTTSYSSRSTEAMLCPSPCQEKWAKGRCVTDLRFSPHRQAGMIFHAAVLAHPLAAESCSNMFKRVLIIVSAWAFIFLTFQCDLTQTFLNYFSPCISSIFL